MRRRLVSLCVFSCTLGILQLRSAETPDPSAVETPLVSLEIPEIHARISLPKDWTVLQGNLLEGGVLIASKEKIRTEEDPWSTGFTMTLDREGAKASGQKASEYALSLARDAREKAGEEASPIAESQNGCFHDIRFDFPVPGEQSLLITEVMRADDATGTVITIVWQVPQQDHERMKALRESILTNMIFDTKP